MESQVQFGYLNLLQKSHYSLKKPLWFGTWLYGQTGLHMAEKPEVRRCQIMAARRMRNVDDLIFNENFSNTFEKWTR
jgi:hypothetical protein